MSEEFICAIPNCKCGGRKGRAELEEENAILRKQLAATAEVVQAMRDQHYYEGDCSGCTDNLHNAGTVLGTLDALGQGVECD